MIDASPKKEVKEVLGLYEAIDTLSKIKVDNEFIINSPMVWKSQFVQRNLNVDYVSKLVIKFAKYINTNKK
jgi:hypothetical protein